MKRSDYLTDESIAVKTPYGQFEVEELIRNRYWLVPLRRGYTEIKRLLQLCKKHDAYVCGGYARYCASSNKRGIASSKDIDIFCSSEEGFSSILQEIHAILSPFTHVLKVHETQYAITFDFNENNYPADIARVREILSDVFPIQVIKPVKTEGRVTIGSLFDILNSFDMSVCQAAIVSEDQVLVSKDFKNKEREGKNVIANIHNPLMTLNRVSKYNEKKYQTTPESLTKLLTYYNKIEDKNVLENVLADDVREFRLRQGNS